MKMNKKILAAILFMALTFFSCEDFSVPTPTKTYDGLTSARISGNTAHSGFTSLVKFNDSYYCAFREGASHAGDGGVIRIIKSKDGNKWETVQVFKLEIKGNSDELNFNGTNQNMVIEHSEDFDYTLEDVYSITLKANVSDMSRAIFYLSNRNGGDGIELGLQKNATLYADLGLPYLRLFQSGTTTPFSAWHHIGYVYDGPNKTVTLYADGKKINYGYYAAGSYPKEFTTQENTYGNVFTVFSKAPNHKTNPKGFSSYTKGQIQFLRFWDKALTLEEIVADQEADVSTNTPNLIAGYDFAVREFDGSSYIVPDIKGKHPGTLRNFTKDDFSPATDLRDPRLCVTSDNRLMLLTDGELYRSGKVSLRRPYVSYSDANGENFSELQRCNVNYPTEDKIDETNSFWLWSIVNNNGIYYAFDYIHFTLFKSTDMGLSFIPVKTLDYSSVGVKPTETTLYIDSSEKMYAFSRVNSANGCLFTSLPPYTDWTCQPLDYRIEGQCVIPFENDSFIIGSRQFDEEGSNPKMVIHVTDLNGQIKKTLELPSSGDCSYPGLVLEKDYLMVSYYSTHEGVSSIYFSKIPVEKLK